VNSKRRTRELGRGRRFRRTDQRDSDSHLCDATSGGDSAHNSNTCLAVERSASRLCEAASDVRSKAFCTVEETLKPKLIDRQRDAPADVGEGVLVERAEASVIAPEHQRVDRQPGAELRIVIASAEVDEVVVLDVWSRKIVGWAMRGHLRTELVLDALDMALQRRQPVNVIHHSDQGCQYPSYAFGQRCILADVLPSTGTVGDAYDNAMCESFFASLECELIDRNRVTDR
jgi:transposase InsO family protein